MAEKKDKWIEMNKSAESILIDSRESPIEQLRDYLDSENNDINGVSVIIDVSDTNFDNETTENEINNTDKSVEETLTSRGRRELKMLLELSKEANLSTNIPYKRRIVDPMKLMEKVDPSKAIEIKKRINNASDDENDSDDKDVENLLRDKTDNVTKEHNLKRKSMTLGGIGGALKDAKLQRKSLKLNQTMSKTNKDEFCWRCHRDEVTIFCETCPRAYHTKCLKQTQIDDPEHWPCPECVNILNAESVKTRSSYLKDMNLDHLCLLLKYALKRMTRCNETEPFMKPVSETEFPDYTDYIINPMDLTKLDLNLKNNLYGSTAAFEADTKWILHNSIIFNSYHSKLTTIAKSIMKTCKQEMSEIQNCPTCYLRANTVVDWFIAVCPKPHILVWAKLKGFPYWPAKAMSTSSTGMVDVRFFGAHDRAWVPVKECFLYSQKDPNTHKQKRSDIHKCVEEVNEHIKKLTEVYGEFNFAPYKTPFNPDEELKQLQIFLPKYGLSDCTIEEVVYVPEIDDTSDDINKSCTNVVDLSENTCQLKGNTYEILDSDDECKLIVEDDDSNTKTSTKDKSSNQESKQLKRIPTYEIFESPPKSSRRNSTQSTYSESSHFSNFSEKSIRNNDDSNLSNQEFTLSLVQSESRDLNSQGEQETTKQNKLHITDKLMKKLKESQTSIETLEKVKKIIGVNSVSLTMTNDKIKRTYSNMSKNTKNISKSSSPLNAANVKAKKDTINDKDNETSNNKNTDSEPPVKYIKLVDIKTITMPTKKNESVLDKQLMTVKQNKAKAEKQKTSDTGSDQSFEKSDTNTQIVPDASLENKKEIFLALNIQEKSSLEDKLPKQREIRTRSKTEEIYKSKHTSKSPFNGETETKHEERTEDTSPNQEIKQKARKTFPRPGEINKEICNIVKSSPTLKPATSQANTGKKTIMSTTSILVSAGPTKTNTAITTATSSANLSNTSLPTQSTLRPLPTLLFSMPNGKEESQKKNPGELLTSTTIVSKQINNQATLNNHILSMLSGLAPAHVSKAAINTLCRSPPPIIPKPQTIFNNDFEDNVPSNAGPVTEKINSIAFRISDYFRGMLVETIKDLNTPEENVQLSILNLKLENEKLKYKHDKELAEIKKNISDILEDIQKTFKEEKQRLVNETKATCEADAIRRVQEAKSKQWCANCFKEAQFYCCWNTSYCGFPCQRSHWPKHMNKCTQNVTSASENSQNTANKTQMKPILPKPTKSYVALATGNNKSVNLIPTSVSNLSELTTNNAELLENISTSIGGKIILKPAVLSKTVNLIALTSIVSSSSTTVTTTSTNVQKTPSLIDMNNTIVTTKTSSNQTNTVVGSSSQ